MAKSILISIILSFSPGYFYNDQDITISEELPEEWEHAYANTASRSKKSLPIEDEYALKAAFIYRFTEYIEWTNLNDENFYVAILNKSLITGMLQAIARTKKIKNKTMIVKEYNTMDEINSCHILFIPKNNTVPIKSVVSKFGNRAVLIITEHDGYGKSGSHLNFVESGNKIKFEANLKAIKKAGINISSELLKLAIIVD